MKRLLTLRFFLLTLLVGLLVLGFGGLCPAGATLMEYNYTGQVFTEGTGTFPPSPAIGTHITIRFLYDGPLPSEYTSIDDYDFIEISEFSISCGDLQKSCTSGCIYGTTPEGLPQAWCFSSYIIYYSIYDIYHMSSSTMSDFFSPPVGDWVYWSYYNYPYMESASRGIPDGFGTWSASAVVPLPPTALLLGSGLLGLAGWRRFRKG